MWETLTLTLFGITSGYLLYRLKEGEEKIERLRSERDYYYRLAVNYYNLSLQKERELSGVKDKTKRLEGQLEFFKRQLAEARKERVAVERLLKEVLKSTRDVERKVGKVLKLSQALAKLEEIHKRLDALATALESDRTPAGRSVRKGTVAEVRRIEKLKRDIERAMERLLSVAEKVEKSSKEYSDFVSEIKGKTDDIIRRFEDQLTYYGESFANAVTKMTNTARSNDELYRQISSERGQIFERFALPIVLLKDKRKIGSIRAEDVYHVGGYAPFDFLIFVPEYVDGDNGRKKKRIKQLIFAEMKTGYSGLSEYEFDFAKKIISLKSDFLKYGIIKISKETQRYGESVWRVSVEVIESEKRLRELLSGYLTNE